MFDSPAIQYVYEMHIAAGNYSHAVELLEAHGSRDVTREPSGSAHDHP